MIPIDVVERWLAEKHCTLWADFDIDDAKGRRAAAEWFRHEVDSLSEWWGPEKTWKPLSERQWPYFPAREVNRYCYCEPDRWTWNSRRFHNGELTPLPGPDADDGRDLWNESFAT